MKKLVFTFLTMVVFAFVANTTFAQSSYDAPYEGAEHIYTWDNVTAASYSYAVTTTNVSPTDSPAATDGSIYTVSSGSLSPGGALAGETSANLGLTWQSDAVGNIYYVWLIATAADGCENWRYVTVQPEANQVDFVLAALGLYAVDETITTLEGAAADNGGNACPTPALRDGAVYDSNGATDDGDVYVYYRVEQGADNNDDSWSFEFAASAGDVEYYTGSAWAAYSTAISVADDAVQLLRVKIATPVATDPETTITGTISNASEDTTGLTDSDVNNDAQSFTVDRVGAIGNFSGN